MNTYRGLESRQWVSSTLLIGFVFWAFMIFSVQTALADQLCIRNFSSSDPSVQPIDGVVAPGESTDACTADLLWPQVGPAHFHPTGSSVESYMYITRITGTNRLRIGIDTAGDPDVSNYDTVLLFFDANNNGNWDDQDFAIRLRVSPEDDPISSGEYCDLVSEDVDSGYLQYYERNGGQWKSNTPNAITAADEISVRYAYDYTQPDAQDKIWNVELEIPINTSPPFHLDTTPNYFAVGGYIFADRGHLPTPDPLGQVKVWPAGLEMCPEPPPGETCVPSGVPQIDQYNGTLLVLQPLPAALHDINLEDVCYDVNFDMAEAPWEINNLPAAENDEHLHRNQNNSFRVTYYFDGPGTNVGELLEPISGEVRLGIKPKTAGSWAPDWWEQSEDVAPTRFNTTHTVDYDFDFRTAPNPDFNSAETNMVCAHAFLDGFTPYYNTNTSNDEMHLNLHYFTTSESRHILKLYGSGLPKLKSGEIKKVYLQMEMSNEHPKLRHASAISLNNVGNTGGSHLKSYWVALTTGNFFTITIWIQLFAGISILATSLVYMMKWNSHHIVPKIGSGLGVLLLIGSLVTACSIKIKPERPEIGTPRWQLTNYKSLGIKPVKGKKDWYEMPLTRGEVKSLALRFISQPLPYKMKKQRLQAAVKGKPNKVDLPVKRGTVVTVFAFGEVDVDGKKGPLPPTSATGFVRKQKTGRKRATSKLVQPLFFAVPQTVIGKRTPIEDVRYRYLLTEGYYAPNEYAGALIGSFDGFKTSFVVGRNESIIVPEQATMLSLAVNAMLQDYEAMIGFYDVGIIITQAPAVPTRTVPGGDATYNIPPTLAFWQALTSLNIYTYYEDPLIKAGQVVAKTMRPWGHAHYVIYDSHATEFRNIGTGRVIQ